MKTFKQILSESVIYMPEQDSGILNLDEELKDFHKVMTEDGGVGYINDRMSIKMKHEHLHEWVMASGYRYQTKTYRPGVVTEHVYSKYNGSEQHQLTIVTKGDQRDVWQVIHHSSDL
jgi:hypothetical protein